MSMVVWNHENLSEELKVPIPEILVIICKNDVAGLEPSDIARLTGFTADEIRELQATPEYKDVRLLLGAAQASGQVETDGNWDSVEQIAVEKLAKEVKSSRDPDFILKAAMVANKAQRRLRDTTNPALDPSKGASTIPLRLTERLIQKMNANGDLTQIKEREISVLNGTAKNPSFATIDRALGVRTERQQQIPDKSEDFDWQDLGLDPV